MPATILLNRSTTSGHVPASLAAGELAQNLPDETLYYRDPSGLVVPLKLPDCERLIARGTVTNAANITISVDPAVIGTFRLFRLHLFDWRSATGSASLLMRLGDASGILTGSNYGGNNVYASYGNGGFFSEDGYLSDSKFWIAEIGDNADNNLDITQNGTIWIFTNDPATPFRPFIMSNWSEMYNLTIYNPWNTCGTHGYSAVIDLTQFRLFHESGNISTGKYVLIGIP